MSRNSHKKTSMFKRIQNKMRHGLAFEAMRCRLERIGIYLTPYYWVQEGLADTSMPEVKCNIEDYSVSFFGPEEMKIIGENARGYCQDKLLARLKNGKKCLGMKRGTEIAVFMWIDLDKCNCEVSEFRLNKNEAYLYDMYTMEAFRGKNIAPYLRYQGYQMLKEIGRDTFYSISDYFNSSSIKFKKKLNAKFIRLVFYISLFGKFRHSFTMKKY